MKEPASQNGVHVDSEEFGGESQIRLSGRITIDSSPGLRATLLRKLGSSECRILTVDFCAVDYIDTSGIAVLLELLKAARQLGKTFQISGLRERPRYLLESTRLLRLFHEAGAVCPE